jgi:hypothetical protein
MNDVLKCSEQRVEGNAVVLLSGAILRDTL